jgi:hypothetical protein
MAGTAIAGRSHANQEENPPRSGLRVSTSRAASSAKICLPIPTNALAAFKSAVQS